MERETDLALALFGGRRGGEGPGGNLGPAGDTPTLTAVASTGLRSPPKSRDGGGCVSPATAQACLKPQAGDPASLRDHLGWRGRRQWPT